MIRMGAVGLRNAGETWLGAERRGPVGSRKVTQVLGQEAEGSANTRMFFIIGAEGPLHKGDYYGY